MADPTPPTPPATPPAGAPPEPQDGGDQDRDRDRNQSEALKRKLRRAEKELESLRKAEEDRKASELSEVDRLKKQLADLTGQLDTERSTAKKALIQARFEQLAAKAGAQNPSAAFKLASLADDLEVDDQAGLETALKALQKSDPYLFGQPQAPTPSVGSSGGNPPNGNGKAAYTADQITAASPEDWARIQADVQAGRAILK